MIEGIVECVYKKSDTGYASLLKSTAIPAPANGNFVYWYCDFGTVAIHKGEIMIGGSVAAGALGYITAVYLAG